MDAGIGVSDKVRLCFPSSAGWYQAPPPDDMVWAASYYHALKKLIFSENHPYYTPTLTHVTHPHMPRAPRDKPLCFFSHKTLQRKEEEEAARK